MFVTGVIVLKFVKHENHGSWNLGKEENGVAKCLTGIIMFCTT